MKTLLLGLDGATFTALNPMIEAGVMPFMKSLIHKGVKAELMSTPCPVTPPAWTSMITGRGPGHHGIFDFIRSEEVNDENGTRLSFRLANARDIQSEPIWQLTARQGKKTGVLNFPATYLCYPFDGYIVPGFVTSRVLRSGTYPRAFWDQIKDLPGFDVKDTSWDLDEGRKPLGSSLDFQNLKTWIDYLKRKENGWFAIAKELIENTDTELIAMVFEGVDRLQHQVWRLLDPEFYPKNPEPWEVEARDYSYTYFNHLDGLLKQLVEAAGEESRAIVVSDHGFGSTTEVFYINAWLEKEGYLTWKSTAEEDDKESLTAHNMRDHFETIDFDKTVAYAKTTSANGVYIRIAKKEGQSGIAPEQHEMFCKEIETKLLDWKDPKTGTPVVINTIRRERAFPGVAMEEAPDITVYLRDGGFISIMKSNEIVKPRSEVKGTHRPNGIFIASGKNIEKGKEIGKLSILDVAPTLLYSMGLSIPTNYDGKVALDAFDSDYITVNPPVIADVSQEDEVAKNSKAGDVEENDENVILERLKSLGYME
ncbi:MAG: alkaline phosphatase family protein [Verrucomicrobiota bacterium]